MPFSRLIPTYRLIWAIFVTLAMGLSAASPAIAQGEQPGTAAEAVFRAAYENRYTWDESFPGFSAEVFINDGQVDQGLVRITPHWQVEVVNIEDADQRELIADQLRMEVTHRQPLPFAAQHGQSRFEWTRFPEEETWMIHEMGPETEAYYQVIDNAIVRVERPSEDIAISVTVPGTIQTPEGYLAVHFKTTRRNPETQEVLQREDVRDFYEKVGRYRLLTYRTICRRQDGDPEEKPVADVLLRLNDIQPIAITQENFPATNRP